MNNGNLNNPNTFKHTSRICITGANGFIARSFMALFKDKYNFITISQKKTQNLNSFSWDDLDHSPNILANSDVVINLAGANIGDKRWSDSRKMEILNSRINSTQKIVNALNILGAHAKLINASAVGIYPTDNKLYDENSILNLNTYNSFSEEITKRWEDATHKYQGNLAITRFGVVLSNKDGALKKIISPFKFGLGGLIGDGNWPFSWISLFDLLNALDYIIMHEELNGVFNLVSPNLISYKELISTICEIYQTKARLNLPEAFIKLMFGQMGHELLLRGQKVDPTKLLEFGFKFNYSNIKDCISAIKNDLF